MGGIRGSGFCAIPLRQIWSTTMPFYLTPKQDDFNKIPELQVCIAEALALDSRVIHGAFMSFSLAIRASLKRCSCGSLPRPSMWPEQPL